MDRLLRDFFKVFDIPPIVGLSILLLVLSIRFVKAHLNDHKQKRSERISVMVKELEKHHAPRYHFVIEQLFQDRFGFLISFPAIQYFIKTREPSLNIYSYIGGFRYLQFSPNFKALSFKKNWSVPRLWINAIGFEIAYGLFAAIALMGTVSLAYIEFTTLSDYAAYLLLVLACFLFAGLSIDESSSPFAAIRLMERLKADDQART